MVNFVVESTWTPIIHHMYVAADGNIHANVSWDDLNTESAVE